MGRKRREYSYDDWKKAMDLHSIYKLGYRRISRILGISENTVKKWIYYGVIPPMAKWKAEPCIELAYTLGTVQGDGNVCKSKPKNKPWYEYIIQLVVIDKEFGEVFSRAMSRLLNKRYIEPYWDNREKAWRVKYNSKAFYTWYRRQTLDTLKPYIEYDIETVRYYLKGLFDSEGNNNRNKQIRLDNTNKELLEYILYLLKKYFSIRATGPYLEYEAGTKTVINGVETYYNQDCYMIVIGKKEHVQSFLKEIGFSIVRKQLGLKKHEKVFIKGIGYVEPYELVKLGLFKLPFSDAQ